MQAQCAVWPQRRRARTDFHAPLTTDVPVLLLSGEFDPVTPPRYGDAGAEDACRNGRHLVLRGQGHNVIGVGCMPKLVGAVPRNGRRESARRQVPGHARATRRRSPASTDGSRNDRSPNDLHKTFKTKDRHRCDAVDGVSFEARDGEITGLLGPNGAGKTTTLRMLYTLMTPDSGRVLVDGIDVARDAEAVRRALGVLPDARGVYKRLTARENIAYFGELHGMDAATIAQRTRALVDGAAACTTSSTARPKASRRASAPRPRSRARWCTIRAT